MPPKTMHVKQRIFIHTNQTKANWFDQNHWIKHFRMLMRSCLLFKRWFTFGDSKFQYKCMSLECDIFMKIKPCAWNAVIVSIASDHRREKMIGYAFNGESVVRIFEVNTKITGLRWRSNRHKWINGHRRKYQFFSRLSQLFFFSHFAV